MAGGSKETVMQCHYCDTEAAVAVEKDTLKVGLCRAHLRDRLCELADDDALGSLQDELDIDRS